MRTAAQAREKALEVIAQRAKEFVLNTVSPKIEEAVRIGALRCAVAHTHNTAMQAAVAERLEKAGYTVIVESSYYDIKWEIPK